MDEESGLYHFEARYLNPSLPGFLSADKMSEAAPGWTPYRAFGQNPLRYIDPDGNFETEAAAKAYAKDNKIYTGWFSNNSIIKQKDGSWAIENSRSNTFTQDLGGDIGIQTGVTVSANKMGPAYTRSIGVAGAFGGGIGFELGYAVDNYGDWGIYGRISGELGIGGGAGFGYSHIQGNNNQNIMLEQIEGDHTEHHAELGPLSWSIGGDVLKRRKGINAFSRRAGVGFGDTYTTSGGGADPVDKSWKVKPKFSFGYRVSMGRTRFLYKNKRR